MADFRLYYVPEDDYDYPQDDIPQDQIDAWYEDMENSPPPGVPSAEELADMANQYGYADDYVPF